MSQKSAAEILQQYDATPANERAEFARGLSSEEKVRLLESLKRRQVQMQYGPINMGYAYTNSRRTGPGDEFEDDEFDYDDMEDDYDEEIERFEADLRQLDAQNGGGSSAHDGMDTPTSSVASSATAFAGGIDLATLAAGEHNIVLATDPNARRKEVGDFELLRLAKMGDLQTFQMFEQGVLLNMFVDNNGRDALHYAVDSGSLELVKYLVEEKKMVLRKDERMKATPLDMAVLLQRDAITNYIKSKFPADAKTFTDALAAFAPAPPRFCIAKAAPQGPVVARSRVFWAADPPVKAATPGFQFSSEVLPMEPTGIVLDTVVTMLNRPPCGTHRGLDAWTQPTNSTMLSSILPPAGGDDASLRAVVVGVAATELATNALAPAAVGIALGGKSLELTIRNGPTTAVATTTPVFVVGGLTVLPQHQQHGAVALLLRQLRKAIPAESTAAALFVNKERLPPQPLALVKWFRRSLRPMRVFSSNFYTANELYPDFFQYDDRLRVDWVAKETPVDALSSTPTLTLWQQVNVADGEQLQFLLTALPALLKKTAMAQSETAYATLSVTSTVVALEQTLFNKAFNAYFIKTADGKGISDFLCLRVRESRPEPTTTTSSSPATESLRCATSIFSVFSSITGEKKLLELVAIAINLNCDTIAVPNTCGMTDSDFSKTMFEEIEQNREYLYCVKGATGDNAAADPSTAVITSAVASLIPTPKVYIPLGLV